MKIYLVLILHILSFYRAWCEARSFFNKHSVYATGNSYSPYKVPFNSPTGLICLAHCNRESLCLTANYNKKTKTCSLYDCKIDANYLVTQSSNVVYIIKSNFIINKQFI